MKNRKRALSALLSVSLLLSVLSGAVLAYDGEEPTEELQEESGNIVPELPVEEIGEETAGEENTVISGLCGDSCSYEINGDTLTVSGLSEMENYAARTAPWTDSGVKKLVVSEGVTSIGSFAFYDMTELESVELPGSLTHIGSYAFSGCTALRTLALPASLQTVSEGAFERCSGLESFSAAGGSTAFSTEDGVLYNADKSVLVAFPAQRGGSFTLPASVRELAPYAFSFSALSSVSCSQPCKLGDYAFSFSALTAFTVPEGVTALPTGCFKGCTALASISLPATLEQVGNSAFESCNSLTEASFAGSREKWIDLRERTGEYNEAFLRCCSSFSSICDGECGANLRFVLGDDYTLTISGSGKMDSYDPYMVSAPWLLYQDDIRALVVEEGVTALGSYAFSGCTKLASVSLPGSCESIGDYCFSGCTALRTLELPVGMKSVGMDAFYFCSALQNVTLPYTLEKLGASAFYYATALQNVYYGDGVSSWTRLSFGNRYANPMCYAEHIYLCGEEPTSISMLPGNTAFPAYVFMNWKSVTELNIPESIRTIGDYCFYGCEKLESVSFPAELSTVSQYAFCGTGLRNVTLPASVSYVGYMAFGRDDAESNPLQSITFMGNVPAALDSCFAIGAPDFCLRITPGAEGFSVPEFNGYPCRYPIGLSARNNAGQIVCGGKLSFVSAAYAPSALKWSLDEESARSGKITISSAGVLSVNKACTLQSVTVTANCPNAPASLAESITLRIVPLTSAVTVLHKDEDTNEYVNVTGKTLSYDISRVAELELAAVAAPEGAGESFTWKSSNAKLATVDGNGHVTLLATGTVKITATANDGSKKAASVTVKIERLAHGIELLTAKKLELDRNEDGTACAEMAAGKSLSFSYRFTDGAGNPCTPTDKKVDWSIVNAREVAAFASVKSGKLTVKPCPIGMTVLVRVTVHATGASDEVEVRFTPNQPKGVLISCGCIVNGLTETIWLENGSTPFSAETVNLEDSTVTWTSSSTKLATVDENGVLTPVKAGTVKLTATGADKKTKATVTVKIISVPDHIRVSSKTGSDVLAATKKLTLQTAFLDKNGAVMKPTSTKLSWTVSDPALATVKNGVVTAAKTITEPTCVTVTAVTTDGSERSDSIDIMLYPLVKTVKLYRDGVEVTGKKAKVYVGQSLQLSAAADPFNAYQGVSWKSSNAKLATVDENGLVTILAKGSVTITATAADGSGKTARYILSVLPFV